MEIWKPVVGFEDRYEVSNHGRVRNLKTFHILRPRNHTAGYHAVTLGHSTERTVHRLVAESFIGPRPIHNDINHKDGNKKNNVIDNLEYVSRKENVRHAHEDLGKDNRGEKHGNSKLTLEQVIAIKRLRASGQTLESLAERFGCSFQNISDISRGKRWGWVDCQL